MKDSGIRLGLLTRYKFKVMLEGKATSITQTVFFSVKENSMATRTAPTVSDITATTIGVTIHLIDASGDITTDYVVASALDLADVQAFAQAYQATTQCSVWKVSVLQEFEGEADPDNADAGLRGEVQSGINLLFRDAPANAKQTPRLVAPISTVMQGNQDLPLLVSPLTTLVTQYGTLMGGDYAIESMQYTSRRERRNNPKIRV